MKKVEKGCIFCSYCHMNVCPDAHTEVAKGCNLYDQSTRECYESLEEFHNAHPETKGEGK